MSRKKPVTRLRNYVAKRDFRVTSEPAGRRSRSAEEPDGTHGLYVVQRHAASHLHYDFRLEHDGVLLSWAVPKEPTRRRGTRRLAVQVEDHPLDYARFEGRIPAGQYGAGTVEIWDRGQWQPEPGLDVDRALARGKLSFRLVDGRLAGAWHLVRLAAKASDRDKRNWLLMPGATTTVPAERPTARTAKPTARAAKPSAQTTKRTTRAPKSPGRAAKPLAFRSATAAEAFELATLVDEPPEGRDWLHETKWDGYRMMAAIDRGRVSLWSRSGGDWSDRLAELVEALAALPVKSAVVDGEVVAMTSGRSGFQALQAALGAAPEDRARRALRFVAFDLLVEDGEDLRALPLVERKRRLAALLARRPGSARGARLLPSPHVAGRGAERLARACARSLEGIVSKRADAPYRPGRGRDWRKSKCRARQELVVVGYTLAKSEGVEDLGALLLAVHSSDEAERDRLVFAGKVGTGFDRATRADLLARLRGLATAKPPLAAAEPGARWVKPRLVVEVEFTEWTAEGRLRHPSFIGLREDKPARDVQREKTMESVPRERPRAAASERSRANDTTVAGVAISHPERLVFPDSKLTKLDLARYFERIWPHIAPHLEARPLAFLRCPEGARATCFFQKHWPDKVRGLAAVDVSEPGEKEPPHARIASVEGLVGAAQRGVVEVHLWGSRAGRLERPDRLVFDLDPGEGVTWRAVADAARLLRDLLEHLGLQSFALSTGGKGLHVVVPLSRRGRGADWSAVRAAAAAIAGALEAAAPERFVARAAKSERRGRIFVDYLRNGRGATAIAPFSPRARDGAPVATPLAWSELEGRAAKRFTIATLPRRLERLARDPWAGYFELDQGLERAALEKLGVAAFGGARQRRGTMAARKSSKKSNRYGDLAGEKVERALHEMKRGELQSGGSGEEVHDRKQAIAIGLSEARRAGGKVPKTPAKKRSAARKK